MGRITASVRIGVLCAVILIQTVLPAWAGSPRGAGTERPAQIAVQYVLALAAEQVEEWAGLDLGCLSRQPAAADRQAAQACWQEMLDAHRALVADDPETGIFGAVGRGVGFGLLSDRHRQSDLWREYPPSLFVSPVVVRKDHGPIPHLKVAKVEPTRPIALVLSKETEPASVRGTAVDLAVTYPDPLTAPLALRPEEVWWTNGAVRRYGPIRQVVVRFIVVSGLRKLGYSKDSAVLNETLPNAPSIPGVRYDRLSESGRAFGRAAGRSSEPFLRSGLVPGSARWWDRAQAGERFDAALRDAQRAPVASERVATLTRLLLLDWRHPEVNAQLGNELYRQFLSEGLARSGIKAQDEAVQFRLAELYWNLQAQTWRQELTAVAVGYEPAADALYGAIATLEVGARDPSASVEIRRRLGAVYRWNNDGESALHVHEELLKGNGESDEPARRGQLLVEIAWDRIQWVSWNRRYDHPWLLQAEAEAQQALTLARAPEEKLLAAEALLLIEALSTSRNMAQLRELAQISRHWYDQIPGVEELWAYLIGNDIVKAVVPEGESVTLPLPPRSPDVLDVGIHARPPAQDLLRGWEFDSQEVGQPPEGFSAVVIGDRQAGVWRIEEDPDAPTAPNVLVQTTGCVAQDCLQFLLADVAPFQYPDVTVQLRLVSGGPQAGAGLALAGRDSGLYAVLFIPATNTMSIYRVENGRAALLGSAAIKPTEGGWHHLRVQRSNFANVSLPRLEIYFDGAEALAVVNDGIGDIDRVGPATQGDAVAKFDAFHVLDMVSNRPLSKPAAY